MQIKIFSMAFDPEAEGFDTGALERFCLNKKVHGYHPHFFEKESQAYWTVLVQYETTLVPGKRKNKQEVLAGLNKEERILFEKLRAWRKDRADTANYPPYLVANDEQFVAVIRNKVMSLEAFAHVPGYGKQKRAKYGKEIIEIVRGFYDSSLPEKLT